MPGKLRDPAPDSEYLSRKQAAEIYGFSVSYLAHLPEGELRQHKRGRKIFIVKADMDAFISGRTTPVAPTKAKRKVALIAVLVAGLLTSQARAQLQPDLPGGPIDSHHGGWLPPGATATINEFGICIVATNHGQLRPQYMWGSLASWQSFVAHPAPGVTHSSCDCGALTEGQTTTVTSTTTQMCPAPDTGTESATVTTPEICQGGQLVPNGPPTTGPFNPATCGAASCEINGVTVPNGGTTTIVLQEPESCQAAGFGPGATGTATTPLTIVEQCNNGTVTQVSSTLGTTNTSQCLNSAGGACLPVSAASCTALNTTDPDPICEWTQAEPGSVVGGDPKAPPEVGWYSDEFKSVLTYAPSANLCTCQGTPTAVGEVTPGGSFAQFSTGADIGPAPNSAIPANLEPPACPNGVSTCIVQPQGACN